MNDKLIREILYFEDHYLNFYKSLKPDVKKKFNWTLQLIATVERIPEKYFKHLTGTDELFEIRVEVGSNIYRVFSFFDKGQLIHHTRQRLSKENAKDPKNEIELAEKLKKQYFDGKDQK